MKTWVWVCIAAIGGTIVYNTWFDAEEGDPDDEVPQILEVPTEASATPAEPAERSLDLDGGPGGTDTEVVVDRRAEEAAAIDAARIAAADKGDANQAHRLQTRLLKEYPDSDPARWILFERGRTAYQKYRAAGKTKEGFQYARAAWRDLTPALFLRESEEAQRAQLRETLAGLARDLLFSSRHVDGVDHVYTPKRGDTLGVLCKKRFPALGARVSPGFVASVNGMRSPKALRAGEPIKVPLGEVSVVVVKGDFRLFVLLNGCYVRDFRVGLGKEGTTPETEFVVSTMNKNPDWYPESGVKIPYGDPRNILGTRWIGFNNSAEFRGFGIHGTKDPASIGKEQSSGCVRMLNRDVELLFGWLRVGGKVTIRR